MLLYARFNVLHNLCAIRHYARYLLSEVRRYRGCGWIRRIAGLGVFGEELEDSLKAVHFAGNSIDIAAGISNLPDKGV